MPGVLPLAIDADGRTLDGIGAPFLRQWVQPHLPDAERRRRSLPAAIVISCTLARRRSGWRERAHHALACGGYHSRLSANALVSNRAFAFEYMDCGCRWHKYVRSLSLRRGRPQWYPDSTSAPRRDYNGDQGRSPEKCHADLLESRRCTPALLHVTLRTKELKRLLRRLSSPNQDRRACTSGIHPPA